MDGFCLSLPPAGLIAGSGLWGKKRQDGKINKSDLGNHCVPSTKATAILTLASAFFSRFAVGRIKLFMNS